MKPVHYSNEHLIRSSPSDISEKLQVDIVLAWFPPAMKQPRGTLAARCYPEGRQMSEHLRSQRESTGAPHAFLHTNTHTHLCAGKICLDEPAINNTHICTYSGYSLARDICICLDITKSLVQKLKSHTGGQTWGRSQR